MSSLDLGNLRSPVGVSMTRMMPFPIDSPDTIERISITITHSTITNVARASQQRYLIDIHFVGDSISSPLVFVSNYKRTFHAHSKAMTIFIYFFEMNVIIEMVFNDGLSSPAPRHPIGLRQSLTNNTKLLLCSALFHHEFEQSMRFQVSFNFAAFGFV